MKISTQIAAAALVFLPVLNATLVLAAPSNSFSTPKVETKAKIPRITRDNFVALTWRTESSPATILAIKGNLFSVTAPSFGNSPRAYTGFSAPSPTIDHETTFGVSNNQLASLIDQLNKSHLGEVAKDNRGTPSTYFTLTFSDKNNIDQSFQFNAYNDSKPESNTALATFLRDLVQMKSH